MATIFNRLLLQKHRLGRWSAIFFGVAGMQAGVQLLTALNGFILIRLLDKDNYAWLTAAYSISAALNIMVDAGLTSGVSAQAGKIWEDKYSLSALLTQALRLRARQFQLVGLVLAPLGFCLLMKSGASLGVSIGLLAGVMACVWPSTSTAVHNVVTRMHNQHVKVQLMEALAALIRLVLVVLGALAGWTGAVVTLVCHIIAVFIQNHMARLPVIKLLDKAAGEKSSADFGPELSKVMRHYYPYALFYCVQGQLSTWLISCFSGADALADFGALNRLGVAVSFLAAPFMQISGPTFARAREKRRMLLVFGLSLSGFLVCCGALMALVAIKGEWMLWLLGDKYAHLGGEMPLVIACFCLGGVVGILMSMVLARGWTKLLWLNIPVLLAVESCLVCLMDLSTVKGVAWFGVIVGSWQVMLALTVFYFNFNKEWRESPKNLT